MIEKIILIAFLAIAILFIWSLCIAAKRGDEIIEKYAKKSK